MSSGDVINLVSDGEDEDTEPAKENDLSSLFELAGLRDLIPPKFFFTATDDSSFFSDKLVSSLTKSFSALSKVAPNKTPSSPSIAVNSVNTESSNNTPKNNGSNVNVTAENSSQPNVFSAKFSLKNGNRNTKLAAAYANSAIKTGNNASLVQQKSNDVGKVKNNDASTANKVVSVSYVKSGEDIYHAKKGDEKKVEVISAAKRPTPESTNSNSAVKSEFNEKMKQNLSNTVTKTIDPDHLLNNLQNMGSPLKSIKLNGVTIIQSSTTDPKSPPVENEPKKSGTPYVCHFCQQSFKYNVALLDHLSSVHQDESLLEKNESSQKKKKSKKKSGAAKSSEKRKSLPSDSTVRKKTKVQTPSDTKQIQKDSSSSNDSVSVSKAAETAIAAENLAAIDTVTNPNSTVESVNSQLITDENSSEDPLKPSKSAGDPLKCNESEESYPDSSEEMQLFIDEGPSIEFINENDENNEPSPENGEKVDANEPKSSIEPIEFEKREPVEPDDEQDKSFRFLTYRWIKSNAGPIVECILCKKLLVTFELFLDHFQKCRRGDMNCTFTSCAKHFTNPLKYRDHLKKDHSCVIFSCKVCKSYFVNKERLKAHQDKCKTSDRCEYRCPIDGCSFSFFYELHFRKHLSHRHKIITSFICKMCKLFFHKESDLNEHFETEEHCTANSKRIKQMELEKEEEEREKESKGENS